MEERLNLREFQNQLAERLKGAGSRGGETARLGFVAGGRHWLTALDQVGEVVTVTRLTRAPWTQPWFLGAAGVRGAIYGCTDLAAFLGLAPAEQADEVRLLLANARFGAHAAFRIERALGLRNTAGMTAVAEAEAHEPWWLARYRDEAGTEWTEIALAGLLTEPRFLRVAA
jgi:twitching motility protein PilI